MTNRLQSAISPYLQSHAENPVDWFAWGREPFAEAARRSVPVLVSIGYSTCHWCHVMARESFSDPVLAEYLNSHFVAVKVDREEHPDVDSTYLAAASAFTQGLGWPLNVFVTPEGNAFYAGTYFPPEPMPGRPSFKQVLEAVTEAWTTRREEVEESSARVSGALSSLRKQGDVASDLPGSDEFAFVVSAIADSEDEQHGGFGGAPKFPVAPVLEFLLTVPTNGADAASPTDPVELAARTLRMMGASPLRDPVEGGFFRYAVNADWSEPHYERMLYDNAQLLTAYTKAWQRDAGEPEWARLVAEGIAGFLIGVMQLPEGGFASAQDSESMIDGERVEGRYYALDEAARATQTPPALDKKVLAGWNGMAIGALARAGFTFDKPEWVDAARLAADYLIDKHMRDDGTLLRASIAGRVSEASATLEDFGMLATGLVELAVVTGEVGYARAAKSLVEASLSAGTGWFGVPGGADPVLVAQGLALRSDPSEGAYPSGMSAMAEASWLLYVVTGDRRYLRAAQRAMKEVAIVALEHPTSFGAALTVMAQLAAGPEQLVVVMEQEAQAGADPLVDVARRWPSGLVACVTEAQAREFARESFELFDGRTAVDGATTAYRCTDFVCQLPATDVAALTSR